MKRAVFGIIKEGLGRVFYLIPSCPKTAQIEITNRCNFNCGMCQRSDLKVPIKDMDFQFYKKIVDRLEGIRELILTGWGEPLLHSQLMEMIEYAKKGGKKVSLTSNGSLLTRELARKLLNTGLDSISFSVDDITAPGIDTVKHPVTTQIKNIENFMEMVACSGMKPEIVIQVTLHADWKKKIENVIKWSAEIGVDMINVNRLDVRFDPKLSRPAIRGEKEFVERIDDLCRQYKIRIDFKPHVAFNGLARRLYGVAVPLMHRAGRHCLRVYDYVYINMGGEVTPCCALPLYSIGNLMKDDLKTIWQSGNFQSFRRHDFQRKICGKCDVLEVRHDA